MSEFVRRRRLSVFYALAVAITLLVMAVYASVANGRSEMLTGLWAFVEARQVYINLATIIWFAAVGNPMAWLIPVFASAPTVSALVTSALADGRAGVWALLSRLRPWRDDVTTREGVRLYGVILALYLVIAGAYLFAAWRLGKPGEFDAILSKLGPSAPGVVLSLLVGLFVDEGGTLEELGWRGFAQPLLQARLSSPLLASCTLGVLWWAWHLPREVPTLLGGGISTAYLVGQGTFLLLCVMESIVIGYAVNRSGGSVWPAIFVHGGTNVWSKAMSGPLNTAVGTDVRTLLVCVAALGIVAVAGRGLGARGRDTPQGLAAS